MWPPLLLAVVLGLCRQPGAASLCPQMLVGPSPHASAFACALRSSRMRPDGWVRGARATMCAQPAESPTQPAESPKRKADQLSPRLITTCLSRANSLSAILDVYKLHGSVFDAINVATAWNRLGKARATSRERIGFFRAEESTLFQLLQHTELLAPRLGARGIANACYGIARLRFEPARPTMRLLGAEAMQRLNEFDAQGLANTAWAFATLGITDHQLFKAIARESKQRMGSFEPQGLAIGSFEPQGLANIAWAFATLSIPAPQLFEAIARDAEQRIGSFEPQGLANTAWAFATLGAPAPQLFEAIARESEQRIGSFNAQGLTNTAWAFATLGAPASQLFEAIARESEQRIGSFKPQELANTAWAFATLGVPAPQFFEAIARESEQRIGSFTPQNIANVAWAFATLGVPAPQLFEAIARESEQRIGSFKPQELANTARAFAIVGTADRGALVKAINAGAAEMGLAAFSCDERRQLHQFFLSVELEACPPAELLVPIGLRDACRTAMAEYHAE
jgi:hypothetical protein